MDNQLFRDIQTGLDLNGPILSFSTQPVGVETAGSVGFAVTFIGIATVSFPGDSSPANSGTIAYQWNGPAGVLVEGTKYVGTATTTLTVLDVISPTDVGNYYVTADYVPSPETGNAFNEPISSNSAAIVAAPILEINAQPTPITTIAERDRNFIINASLSDNGTDLSYQWQLDGEDISDGTIQKSTLTPVVGTQDVKVYLGNFQTPPGSAGYHTIPKGASRIRITIAGGVGGRGGGDFVVPNNPSLTCKGGRGGNGMEGIFILTSHYFNEQYTPSQLWESGTGIKDAINVELRPGQGGSDGVLSGSHGDNGGVTWAGGDGGDGGAQGDTSGGNSSGNAGSGGGGGGASVILLSQAVSGDWEDTVRAVVAAGGGGGGGAYNQQSLIGSQPLVGNGLQGGDSGPARGGSHPNRGTFEPPNLDWHTVTGDTSVGLSDGGHGVAGHNNPTDPSAGGGGGGGGSNGGDGGHHGHNPAGGRGGGAGSSGYNRDRVWRVSGAYNQAYSTQSSRNGYVNLEYTIGQQQVTTIQNVTRTTTVTGSSTPQLTLNTDGPGIGYTAVCEVSSLRASNSPITSLEVGYNVESTVGDADIVVEAIGVQQSTASISQVNLSHGEITLGTVGTNFQGTVPHVQLYSLYAHNKDVNVEMDLYGGGASDGSAGEGGFSRIRFTMKHNEEYVIAGLTEVINTPFLYRKASLIACVGEAAKTVVVTEPTFNTKVFKGRGGDGGGIGIAGGDGIHGHLNYTANGKPGKGGPMVPTGGLSLQGIFGSAWGNWGSPILYPGDSVRGITLYKGHTITGPNGGRALSCTKGVWWADFGIPPCTDVSTTGHFRLSDGTVVENTAKINRGYKAGYNIMQTAGGDYGHGTKGGNGATGGSGGLNDPGGGGSGYTDGSVEVISSTQGGSTGPAKVVIRVVT